MRHSVAPRTADADRRQFADDVEYYLSLTPRQLPSRYLYDDLGSALFEAICRLPWYHITRTEQRLLNAHAGDILALAGPPSTIVELGPGSGDKLATLVEGARSRMTVHLVDISAAALDAASRALDGHADVSVVLHQAPYEAGLAEATSERRGEAAWGGRTLTLFLGSNIGNFDPPGAHAFLRNIRAALAPGDAFLIGVDLVKPERDLVLAYNDPLGVSAAFNLNVLLRINTELGGSFDLAAFRHKAIWNARLSRMEMYLVSTKPQHVHVDAIDLDIDLDEGEAIWTESSYKYTAEGLIQQLDGAGFDCVAQWRDRDAAFAVTLAVRREP